MKRNKNTDSISIKRVELKSPQNQHVYAMQNMSKKQRVWLWHV